VESQNIAMEYRWAENGYGWLPVLGADLVRRRAAVIVADSVGAAPLAKASTPIVFAPVAHPIALGQ
jgi:hypothetical protein